MKKILQKLIRKENLSAEECLYAIAQIKEGIEPVQIAAFLALLRAKGETVQELVFFVSALRAEAKKISLPYPILDIVGTGGDGVGTVNISTGSALLAARCGVPIVKHGNRAVSSQCGSADVLEALGFQFDTQIEKSLNRSCFAFCFAPDYHPLMQSVRPIRAALKVPTFCNLIGPLLNPAGLDHLMIGVFDPAFVPIIAEVLLKLGTKRSLVFHGNGLDELSCLGAVDALLVTGRGIETMRIDPKELGLRICNREDLQGGDKIENAMKLALALKGRSPLTDTLVLNAGVGLFLYGKAANLQEGISMAKSHTHSKSLHDALRKNPAAILAEIKRASPSKGKIGEIPDVVQRALGYVMGGAAALSVLTSSRFEGSLEDLRAVTHALSTTQIPVLRKDFISEPIQLAQTAVHGADAVLLIAASLKEKTAEMMAMAKQMGLEAVVEVHTEQEIAYGKGAEILGVNQRDLSDFSMHKEVHEQLIGKIPEGAVRLAESGIQTAEDARHLFSLGYDALLVGEALTRAINPLELLSAMRGGLCT